MSIYDIISAFNEFEILKYCNKNTEDYLSQVMGPHKSIEKNPSPSTRSTQSAHYRKTADVWQELFRQTKERIKDTISPILSQMTDSPPHEVVAPDAGSDSRADHLKLLYDAELDQLQQTNYNEWNSTLKDACIIAYVIWVIDGSPPPNVMPDTDIVKNSSAVR